MPVTAKLSRRFYDTFGDEIANEFVEWFNSVDAQYRADLRDMLDQRFATQDARIEQRFAAQDVRIERRLAAVDARLAGFEARMESQLERLESRLLGRMEGMIASVRTSQQKWTIGLWTATMLAVIAARLI